MKFLIFELALYASRQHRESPRLHSCFCRLGKPVIYFFPIGKQLLKLGRFCIGLKCAASLGKPENHPTGRVIDLSGSRTVHQDLPPYCSNWNRLSGGYPASNSTNFMRGTEASLQTFRMFISSVGLFQSLFDSQVTCTQEVFFSQEHTFSGRPAAFSSSVR